MALLSHDVNAPSWRSGGGALANRVARDVFARVHLIARRPRCQQILVRRAERRANPQPQRQGRIGAVVGASTDGFRRASSSSTGSALASSGAAADGDSTDAGECESREHEIATVRIEKGAGRVFALSNGRDEIRGSAGDARRLRDHRRVVAITRLDETGIECPRSRQPRNRPTPLWLRDSARLRFGRRICRPNDRHSGSVNVEE